MNLAPLLHFPPERTTTTHKDPPNRNTTLKRVSESGAQVIPFPGNSKQSSKQTKSKAELSSIKVNTRLYRSFHPLPPKGIRSWGFGIGDFTETFWVHDLPYVIAAKQAMKEAQRVGAETVIVLP